MDKPGFLGRVVATRREELGVPITVESLEREAPKHDCGDPKCQGRIVTIAPGCHVGPLFAAWEKGTDVLTLNCPECGVLVANVRIAQTQPLDKDVN